VDPTFVIESFRKGADGVIVAGCHPNDCHYINGNEKTAVRAEFMEEFMENIGIEPERFRLEWIAGSEGEKFARTVNEMVEQIKLLGPMAGGEE